MKIIWNVVFLFTELYFMYISCTSSYLWYSYIKSTHNNTDEEWWYHHPQHWWLKVGCTGLFWLKSVFILFCQPAWVRAYKIEVTWLSAFILRPNRIQKCTNCFKVCPSKHINFNAQNPRDGVGKLFWFWVTHNTGFRVDHLLDIRHIGFSTEIPLFP